MYHHHQMEKESISSNCMEEKLENFIEDYVTTATRNHKQEQLANVLNLGQATSMAPEGEDAEYGSTLGKEEDPAFAWLNDELIDQHDQQVNGLANPSANNNNNSNQQIFDVENLINSSIPSYETAIFRTPTQTADGGTSDSESANKSNKIEQSKELIDENSVFPQPLNPLIGSNAVIQGSDVNAEDFDLITLAFRQSGYLDYSQFQNGVTMNGPNMLQEATANLCSPEHILKQPLSMGGGVEYEYDTSVDPLDPNSLDQHSHYDWDIKNLKVDKVQTFDPYDMWPDGNVRKVYSMTNEKARRHQSGWAMRNTNNHNPQLLKKSCLGVLECSAGCVQSNGKSVYLRPAICDKARRKQCLRKCLTEGCTGKLVQRPCKGHGGYPVTHFWRFANGGVYFESKGRHDHPKPTLKCIGNSNSSNDNLSWTSESKNIDNFFNEIVGDNGRDQLMGTFQNFHGCTISSRNKENKRKRKNNNNQSKHLSEKYMLKNDQTTLVSDQFIDFNQLNGSLSANNAHLNPAHTSSLLHPEAQQNISFQQIIACQESDPFSDNNNQSAYQINPTEDQSLNYFTSNPSALQPSQGQVILNQFLSHQQSDPEIFNYVLNYTMEDGGNYNDQLQHTSNAPLDVAYPQQSQNVTAFHTTGSEGNPTCYDDLASNNTAWYSHALPQNNLSDNQPYFEHKNESPLIMIDPHHHQQAFKQVQVEENISSLDSFTTSQYTSYSSSCDSTETNNTFLLVSNNGENVKTDINQTTEDDTNSSELMGGQYGQVFNSLMKSSIQYSAEKLCGSNEIEKTIPFFWKNIKVP